MPKIQHRFDDFCLLNIKHFGKNSRQIDAAYFWVRLALLLAPGLANFMTAGVYDEAASIT